MPSRCVRVTHRPRRCGLVGRGEGIARQQVLQIGDDQLLVLLLVLQPELHERTEIGLARRARQQALHARVDVRTIGADLVERRARQQSALGPRMLRPDRVVVRVEEHPERRGERHEPGLEALEHERLEEPGGVPEMPLHRARIGHRLQCTVFRRQGCGKTRRCVADLREAHRQAVHRCEAVVECRRARRRSARHLPSSVRRMLGRVVLPSSAAVRVRSAMRPHDRAARLARPRRRRLSSLEHRRVRTQSARLVTQIKRFCRASLRQSVASVAHRRTRPVTHRAFAIPGPAFQAKEGRLRPTDPEHATDRTAVAGPCAGARLDLISLLPTRLPDMAATGRWFPPGAATHCAARPRSRRVYTAVATF